MARSNQTFRKRQRENKLREKARLKRELRQQRRSDKKARDLAAQPEGVEPILVEIDSGAGNEPDLEEAG